MKEHKTFKPFEKVLVQNLQGIWMIDFYSNWNEKWQGHQTFKVNGDYAQTDDGILPYEGNEHLVGTTDEPQIPISEKETQDAYWANCTEEEKANLRRSYNEFLKDDARGRSILEKVCGKHNLQGEAEEEIKLEEGEYMFVINSIVETPYWWNLIQLDFVNTYKFFDVDGGKWDYAIKFSHFNPNDMEETKKHILCVKNGRIIRYKG